MSRQTIAIQRSHYQNRLGFFFQLPSGSILKMHNLGLGVKMTGTIAPVALQSVVNVELLNLFRMFDCLPAPQPRKATGFCLATAKQAFSLLALLRKQL